MKSKYNLLIYPLAKNDIVFYRVRNQEIQVIRVLYGMRNYEEVL